MNDYSVYRFFYVIDYKIDEGDKFLWKCYGDNAWGLTNSGGGCFKITHEVGAIFDRKTLVIYEVSCHDYDNKVSYRWIHPDYIEKVNQEAKENDVDNSIAYDDVKFTDLVVFEGWESITREIISKYE